MYAYVVVFMDVVNFIHGCCKIILLRMTYSGHTQIRVIRNRKIAFKICQDVDMTGSN